MDNLTLERTRCLSRRPVPLVEAASDIKDVQKLFEDCGMKDVKVLSLSFKAAAGTGVGQALKLKVRWWSVRQGEEAFAQDTKEPLQKASP